MVGVPWHNVVKAPSIEREAQQLPKAWLRLLGTGTGMAVEHTIPMHSNDGVSHTQGLVRWAGCW